MHQKSDVETGLFMVGHRYYNPEWGRWLSPDDIEYLDPESINGLNLYAYCNNDPVNKYDPTGHFGLLVTLLFSTAAGAAIAGGIELYKQLKDNGFDFKEVDYTKVGTKALLGAATGLAFGAGGAAAGIVNGSMSAISLFGTTLTAAQSVGLLLGTAAVTNFAAGVGAYAIESSSNGNGFDTLTGISKGIGQLGKGLVSATIGASFVGFGFWNVGVGASKSACSFIGRVSAKFLLELFPGYVSGGF